jgi:hypothetical protein
MPGGDARFELMIGARVKSLFSRHIRDAVRPATAMSCDNLALTLLQSFGIGYLPWTGASIRPAALCCVLNEIIVHQRKQLVEFGAGISTIYAARVLQDVGGRMTTFEHDERWRDVVERYLAKNRLQDVVNLVHAPLAPCANALGNCEWYDGEVVRANLKHAPLDGVIVDGPPAGTRGLELSRYPAVPAIQEFLADSFFIYLDDIGRRGEREVFDRWQRLLNLTGTVEPVFGNYGIMRRGSQFATAIKQS